MKAYTVLWNETATNQLVEIWLTATDRAEVNDSVTAIDAVLSADPLEESTRDLAEGFRTLTVLPLRVVYSIEEQDRIVEVAAVRRVVLSSPKAVSRTWRGTNSLLRPACLPPRPSLANSRGWPIAAAP